MADPVTTKLESLGFRLRETKNGGDTLRIASRGGQQYAVTVKRLKSIRAEQVFGVLADSVVRSRSIHHAHAYTPLVVLLAPRWSPKMVERVLDYRWKYLDGAAVALLDDRGWLHFGVTNEEPIVSQPQQARRSHVGRQPTGDLFTDLNQWLLKLLVKQAWKIQDVYLAGSVANPFSTHAELATSARVSINRAWNLRALLEQEGFLGEPLVRVDELLDRWRAAAQRRRTVGVRWRISTDRPMQRIAERLAGRARWNSSGEPEWTGRRACLAGFSAAKNFGLGFVAGALPDVYVEKLDDRVLKDLGVTIATGSEPVDLYLAEPRYAESVFRACPAGRDGTPTTDVIQTWLDVVNRPERGAEQAAVLRERVLHAP